MPESSPQTASSNPYTPPESSLIGSTSTPNSNKPEIAALKAFVGPKETYYLNKWAHTLEPQEKKARSSTFNWAACLLSGFWLAYRKMYRAAFMLFGFIVLESAIEIAVQQFFGLEIPAGLDRALPIGIAAMCGSFGNQWYLTHARQKIAEIQAEGLSETALAQKLGRSGGTSFLAVLVSAILFIAVIVGMVTVAELIFTNGMDTTMEPVEYLDALP